MTLSPKILIIRTRGTVWTISGFPLPPILPEFVRLLSLRYVCCVPSCRCGLGTTTRSETVRYVPVWVAYDDANSELKGRIGCPCSHSSSNTPPLQEQPVGTLLVLTPTTLSSSEKGPEALPGQRCPESHPIVSLFLLLTTLANEAEGHSTFLPSFLGVPATRSPKESTGRTVSKCHTSPPSLTPLPPEWYRGGSPT